jgi:hypothetical protein
MEACTHNDVGGIQECTGFEANVACETSSFNSLILVYFYTQILLQLYALKLLKMQAKYLGRPWRKSNMEIMSAIYSKVRHR